MNDFLNDIQTQFNQVNGFENKYMLLLKLAKTGSFLAKEQCIEKNEVGGCEAKVWLCASQKEGKTHFVVSSDARLIKSILWLIVNIANQSDQTKKIDYVSILLGLGLGNVVSQSRQNGILKIQQKIERILVL
ncbi:MAG: SufE family protein [Saccharospirillaceae bacterium]|nr:SufE family protein [Pseudomonadales bacterium]NRB79998.1 SufE family protein [Saccharospirillaceae bacterium]